MGSAPLAVPRRRPVLDRAFVGRAGPTLLAAIAAAIWLGIGPPTVDLAAHVYRAKAPLSPWDGNWYAGHHTYGYSVLFPPLGWLAGVRLAGALSAVAAAALFERLAHERFGERALPGALWFGAATVTTLLHGRLTFMLGVAVGLGALLALERRRTALAVLLALACTLASPVAALFLTLAAVALAIAGSTRALAVALAALVSALALVAAFPEGGYEPFATSAFIPLPILVLAVFVLLPRGERALRAGAGLYVLAGASAYVVHTPVGSNVVRLGTLFGGPIVALAVPLERRQRLRALAAACLVAGFAWWQISPTVADVAKVAGDPAATAAYYRPLLAELERVRSGPARVEIPFTRAHWEAAEVAPRFPLARGWERQLDIARNPIFYGGEPLTAATYAHWLSEHAVGFVALPDVTLDYSAKSEGALIKSGLPYLILRWRGSHWRLYEFVRPHPLVVPLGAARITAVELASARLALRVEHPGAAIVRVAWTPYWRLPGGCVARAGAWTRVVARRPGDLTLAISLSPLRLIERGRRCG